MKKKLAKKIVTIGTVAMMFFSGVIPTLEAAPKERNTVSASETVGSKKVFEDSTGHWGQKAIERWNEYGVVKGYNGSFRPNAPVTRAEFSMMIDNIMQYIEEGSNSFTDLSIGKWYYDAMLKLNTAGVLNGAGGLAMPEKSITRQEAAVLIAGAFNVKSSEESVQFGDNNQIAEWAIGPVQSLVAASVIGGLPDGNFNPQANLTRAEAVTIFDNLIKMLITEQGEYSQDIQGNVVVNTPGVTLKDMKISGDLYVTQGVGEGEVTLNNVEITGDVHVQGGGEHSIIFNNVDVKGALVVNKYNGKVRILATGSTDVSLTILESGAMVVTKGLTGGGFETIEIAADIVSGQEIKLDGAFNKVVNHSADIKLSADGTIKEFVAEADTNISGKVSIDKGTGNKNVLVNGVTASPSTQSPATGEGTNSGSGNTNGNSSGNTGGGNTEGTSPVAVTGVNVNPTSLSLVLGQSKQLTASVAPSNATNKKVSWKVEKNSTSVLSISESGIVTANSPGTGTVVATTEDGGYTSSSVITVSSPKLGIKLTKYEGALVDPEFQIEESTKLNSAGVEITEDGASLIKENHYDASITASESLQQGTVTTSVYSIISLTNDSGQPLEDVSAIQVTLNGQNYTPDFGVGLNQNDTEMNFLLKLNIENPEKIEKYNLLFSQPGYEDTSMTITYRPVGTVTLQGIEEITGQQIIGSELSAGSIKYDGEPSNENVSYQWFSSNTETGLYKMIKGATSPTYTLTNADEGKYIRVWVSADEVAVSGAVISKAIGPVQKPVNVDDIFSKIEKSFLGVNTDENNIVSNLSLPISLPDYPGVVISWSTSDEQVITKTGIVTRNEQEDRFVTLTAELSGNTTGTKNYKLTVRSVSTDNVGIEDYIDKYFTDGYPQAYIKDGTIHVKYALNAPAEVYMVVNSINGAWKSDVKAVLEGHSGEDNYPIYVDSWPYFHLDVEQVNKVQDFDTGININNRPEAKVDFVIVDEPKGYTSSNVTSIHFDQTVIGALDTTGPQTYSKYINDQLDTIYIYYNEKIDLESVPSAADFTLSKGQVKEVSLFNIDRPYGIQPSYAKLKVSGITEQDLNQLTVSYNGSAIRDMSDAQSKADSYQNQRIDSISPKINHVTISSDRSSALVEIEPGWDPNQNVNLHDNEEANSRFIMTIAGTGYHPNETNYSYSSKRITFKLKFKTPLPEGEGQLKFNSGSLIDWAYDKYPSELISESIVQLPEAGIPTATYSEQSGEIILTFAEGYQFNYSSLVAGYVLRVDGVEYYLRGYIASSDWNNKNQIRIQLNEKYSWKYKQAVEQGTNAQIKYVKLNGEHDQQMSDAAGTLLPDFDYVSIIKQP